MTVLPILCFHEAKSRHVSLRVVGRTLHIKVMPKEIVCNIVVSCVIRVNIELDEATTSLA